MARISVLFPVKGDPLKVALTICHLASLAAHPSQVEYVLVLDVDDPSYAEWRYIVTALNILGHSVFTMRGSSAGYENLQKLYLDGLELARGQYILFLNDDVRTISHRWDDLYCQASDKKGYSVAAAYLKEAPTEPGGSEGTYPWAFPFMRRELAGILKQVDIGTAPLDRIMQAYVEITDRGVQAQVGWLHTRSHMIEGTPRKAYTDNIVSHRDSYRAKWREIGQRIADAVQAKLATEKI